MSWRREKQWIKFCEKNDPERPTSVHLARRRCASCPAPRLFFSSVELGGLGGRAVVPADWVTRCITPVASADELRRYGYQWFVLDIAFGKPKGWAAGRLERMWMAQGEGGQRLFIIPALHLIIAITCGNYGTENQWIP